MALFRTDFVHKRAFIDAEGIEARQVVRLRQEEYVFNVVSSI